MGDLQVRDLSLDDHDAALDVRTRSFGPLPSAATPWWDRLFERTVRARRALAVEVDGVLVASTRIHQYRQLWGGRALPMAGVAGVVVAPEWRGRGVARLLLNATIDRAIELGDVVSVLFPAVVTPYRRLGWELAGQVARTTFGADDLRRLAPGEVPVRRATADDADTIVTLLRLDAERTRACGPLELTHEDVRERLTEDDTFCYLAPDGFLAYAWDGNNLRVERLVAMSSATTRSLWAVVGSGASVVQHVSAYLPTDDPVHWILDGKAELQVDEDRWMLRMLDAPAAVAGRGFPMGLSVDVPLRLDDPLVDRCAGSFRLQVVEGSGELRPADPEAGAVRLGPNGFAAMFAGTPMTTLRRAGLAAGGSDANDVRLDAVFCCRTSLMDSF